MLNTLKSMPKDVAAFIRDGQESEEVKQQVEQRECQLVYGSPKVPLSSKTCHEMLTSEVYKE